MFVFGAFGIQHAMRIRHIVICDLLCSTVLFFSTSHERHDSQEKNYHKISVLIFFYNVCLKYFSF